MPSDPKRDDTGAAAAMTATALALGIGTSSTAEAERDPAPPPRLPGRPDTKRPRGVRIARSARRRRPARLVRGTTPRARFQSAPAATARPPDGANTLDTQSELRDWIKENATLMSNASLLISISAIAISVLPTAGFLNPYIQALMFGAALLLLIELHHQWPDDLQIHMFRGAAFPQNHSWRMTAFAVLLQIATVLFALWATLNNPIILFPLTAFAVIVAFRLWYFPRCRSVVTRAIGIIALVLVLVVSEILMLAVWAAIADETVTIELDTGEPPSFDFGP